MLEFSDTTMLFWLCATGLTLLAVLAAIWPLLKPQAGDDVAESSTYEGTQRVLIDQLDEIKRDRARGLLSEAEEENARGEVARRLLALDREEKAARAAKPRRETRAYPWAAIVLIPLAAVGLYTFTGAPGQPDQPITARPAEAKDGEDMAVLVSRVEAHLEKNPEDGKGWQTIAPVYQRLGRLDDAENAYEKALEIGTADKSLLGRLQNGLGQIMAMKSGGAISDKALDLFRLGQINDPTDPTGFFFEALALSQAAQRDEAIIAWETLIQRFGADNPPWLEIATRTLNLLKQDPPAAQSGTQPGPTADDVNAAENLSAAERTEMIETMVAGLAVKLDENPDNLPGWRRLIRSYMVLGEKNKAAEALAKARAIFKGSPEAVAALNATAREHGL